MGVEVADVQIDRILTLSSGGSGISEEKILFSDPGTDAGPKVFLSVLLYTSLRGEHVLRFDQLFDGLFRLPGCCQEHSQIESCRPTLLPGQPVLEQLDGRSIVFPGGCENCPVVQEPRLLVSGRCQLVVPQHRIRSGQVVELQEIQKQLLAEHPALRMLVVQFPQRCLVYNRRCGGVLQIEEKCLSFVILLYLLEIVLHYVYGLLAVSSERNEHRQASGIRQNHFPDIWKELIRLLFEVMRRLAVSILLRDQRQ